VFLDIIQDGHKVQGVCDFGKLNAFSGVFAKRFRDFYHLIRRGDIICELLNTGMLLPVIYW
jgi:lysyl-tRNA synthetase class 2